MKKSILLTLMVFGGLHTAEQDSAGQNSIQQPGFLLRLFGVRSGEAVFKEMVNDNVTYTDSDPLDETRVFSTETGDCKVERTTRYCRYKQEIIKDDSGRIVGIKTSKSSENRIFPRETITKEVKINEDHEKQIKDFIKDNPAKFQTDWKVTYPMPDTKFSNERVIKDRSITVRYLSSFTPYLVGTVLGAAGGFCLTEGLLSNPGCSLAGFVAGGFLGYKVGGSIGEKLTNHELGNVVEHCKKP